MPKGDIQLLACGNESEIFNLNPEISFFRNAYRRHSNFYIANQESLNNNAGNQSKLNYTIPKDGDFLSKSYIKFIKPNTFSELFFEYQNLNTTLNTNILNFYDSYIIRTNSFFKNDITQINLIKYNIGSATNSPIQNGFTIFSSNIPNSIDLISIINTNENTVLQTDTFNYYYNISPEYYFYSYVSLQPIMDNNNSNNNVLSNPIVEYLVNAINYQNINFIRIDFVTFNSCFKITFSDKTQYQTIVNLILNSIESSDNIMFKIDQYELYFSLNFSNQTKQQDALDIITNLSLTRQTTNNNDSSQQTINNNKFSQQTTNNNDFSQQTTNNNELTIEQQLLNIPSTKSKLTNNSILYNRLKSNYLNNNNESAQSYENYLSKLSSIKSFKVTLIDNKIKSTTYFTNNAKQLFSNIKSSTTTFYNIISSPIIPEVTLYKFGDATFFGNFDNIDFNSSLIADETLLINNIGFSNNSRLSLNTYLQLFVSYFTLNAYTSNNTTISIPNYLTYISNPSFSYNTVTNFFSNNTQLFNNLTLNILYNPNTLILNYDNLQSILYQRQIKDVFTVPSTISSTNLIMPYINRKPFTNTEIILNKYIYQNLISNINTAIPSAFNINNNITNTLILLNLNGNQHNIVLYSNILYNYDINNFVFDYSQSSSSISPLISYNPTNAIFNNDIVNLLYYYNFMNVLIQSINPLSNIYNQPSNKIYQPSGQQNEILFNLSTIGSIFPLSSNLFIYKNNNQNSTVFNTKLSTYLIKLLDIINLLIIDAFETYKTDYNNTITLPILTNFSSTITNNFSQIIENYYQNSIIDSSSIDLTIVNSFLDELSISNFNVIYNIDLTGFNLIDFVLNNMFVYVDKTLFNGSFQNQLNINILNNNPYGIKFLFSVNSPLYRLFYLFSFLSYMTLDVKLINIMPFDLVILRDFTISFILQILSNFNNLAIAKLLLIICSIFYY